MDDFSEGALSFDRLVSAIEAVCKRHSCSYALLFGSWSRGRGKKYSDVDVAVKLKIAGNHAEKSAEIAAELEEELGVEVDVVSISTADSVLKYEIFAQGTLVFCENKDEFLDDKVNAVDEYLDFKPCFEKHFRRVVEEIKRASSGG